MQGNLAQVSALKGRPDKSLLIDILFRFNQSNAVTNAERNTVISKMITRPFDETCVAQSLV
jgi:hypothetical protein